MSTRIILCLLLVLALAGRTVVAGNPGRELTEHELKSWHFLDPEMDSVPGAALFRAYQYLSGKKSVPVVVAVIDSGFDLDQEDLREVLWINPGEVAGNAQDDDGNGYADDVHGWNFIGGKNGNVNYDNLEVTREYVRLRDTFEPIPNTKHREYLYWLEISSEFTDERDHYLSLRKRYESLSQLLENSVELLGDYLMGDSLSSIRVEMIDSDDEGVTELRNSLGKLLRGYESIFKGGSSEELPAYPVSEVTAWLDRTEGMIGMYVDYLLNPDYDPRHIVGDDYSNPKERYYGNNDVGDYSGRQGYHGTHVAGIIGAKRDNGLGMDGVAGDVRLMLLRTVPSGDERDKDVANSIKYAVDNGARVVNMSFGKFYSPQSKVVYKAIRYAEKKGVLLVHGAGNESTLTDVRPSYPNPWYKRNREAANWLEVGASSRHYDENLPADFTNYGTRSVHLFAPGVDIYSTMPGNTYRNASGTSMASPVVAGVAALLMSYYPSLSAGEVREIILKSVYRLSDKMVLSPETGELVDFGSLSQTGGIVNAYRAIKLAEEYGK